MTEAVSKEKQMESAIPDVGVVYGMPREQYDLIPRTNWSKAKHIAKSPAHARYAMTEEEEDTDAKLIGRAVHSAVLEPELFRSTYAIWDGDRRAGKAWDAFEAKNSSMEILRSKDAKHVKALQDAVRGSPDASRYLVGGKREVTVLWTHSQPDVGDVPGFRMPCKARIDFESNAGVLVDLKKTRNASPRGFGAEVWKYRYDAQAAMYQDAFFAATGKRYPYVFVAVEDNAPHVVQVYTVPEHVLEAGREHYRELLQRFFFCLAESRWPGYFDGESELELPRWATSFDEEDDVSGIGLEFAAAEG